MALAVQINTHSPQPFGIMKRSLGPQWWLPRQGTQEGQKRHAGAIQPLVEGPAGSKQPQHKQTSASESVGERVKQYARGSLEVALREIKESPEQCAQHIWERSRASNAHGPQRSREKTWETLATHAGFRSAFELSLTWSSPSWELWIEQAIGQPNSTLKRQNKSISCPVSHGLLNCNLPRNSLSGRVKEEEAQPSGPNPFL